VVFAHHALQGFHLEDFRGSKEVCYQYQSGGVSRGGDENTPDWDYSLNTVVAAAYDFMNPSGEQALNVGEDRVIIANTWQRLLRCQLLPKMLRAVWFILSTTSAVVTFRSRMIHRELNS
jgi:hypothetical protein